MDSRCAGCEVEEKLKNLQVLRHVMRERKRRCEAPDEECTGRYGAKGGSGDPEEDQPENNAGEKTIRRR